ncbi:MAG TPA: hypothetical protein VFV08_16695, partial [Puia sp.]|nr:hypothetical protein [Puia sp.]
MSAFPTWPAIPSSPVVTPEEEDKMTIHKYMMQQYPLPLGDMMKDPLTLQPWWKFQTLYFHHLLRLHPGHTNTILPSEVDPHIIEGPVAKFSLLLRDLVMESQMNMNYDKVKGMPSEIKAILPLLQPLTSLGFLTCIYTIFMPIMANNLPISAWDHLFGILQLMLTTMKAHTKSESGMQIQTKKSEEGQEEISPYKNIYIPPYVVDMIQYFKGEVWRSKHRILIRIPPEAWINYMEESLNIEDKHHFEQVAWIQISQYHAKDLREAIDETTIFEDISNTTKEWEK